MDNVKRNPKYIQINTICNLRNNKHQVSQKNVHYALIFLLVNEHSFGTNCMLGLNFFLQEKNIIGLEMSQETSR